MKKYIVYLESMTPYGQGRFHGTEKLERESDDHYAERTVMEKLHTTGDYVTIPPMAFQYALEEAAIYSKLKIPGGRGATYTKHFRQGMLFNEPIILDAGPEKFRIQKVFTWADPSKRSGSRVWRYFPVIDHWQAPVPFTVVDEILTPDLLRHHWKIAGLLIGIGVWRPQNRGQWGKFKLLDLEEKEVIEE